jgi:[glutamine synthetase] adenylyltransferase / [glutamine synthetase]-adenylyl-L-tyrosine phosphorylase
LRIEGHNLKLGQGGIREIEFYAQTRQLIAGGRDISLRDPTTLGALSALAAKGWIKPEEAEALSANYLAHRDLEHRLQMVNDAQTHDLPLTSEGIDRIAAFSGQGGAAFRTDLLARLAQTDQITTGFFAPDAAPETPNLTPQQSAIVDSWAQYPALRSARAATIFARLTPLLLNRLQGAANPDEALIALDGFLAGLPAGVQIFSLFEANPQLVDLIVDIAATAPQLAAYLSRHSLVLDGVLGGSFFAPWPDALADQLAQVLRPLSDYEQKLDAARIWQKEWHFRIGVHLLRGLIDGDQAGRQYSDLANAVISALWPVVCAEFARRHGAAPGRGAAVLGMGSLGAGRLNAASDLDVIVIYDALGIEASDGLRALPTRQYFARLTQAFVTAISAQTTKGRLYEVDVRLRPSGRKGPVATSLASFHSYQMNEAWTWEHLALTRARVMAGSADLAADIEALRLQIITLKGQGPKVLADVADMRARLAVTKAGQGAWEAKLGAGRMMDIELFAQALALQAASPARAAPDQIRAGVSVGKLSQSDGQDLVSAYTVMSRLQTALRLVSQVATGPETLGQGGRDFVSRSVQDLDRFVELAARADVVITAHLAQKGDGDATG